MAPPTLMSMAQRNLIRNLSNLHDVGDAPYAALKPALRKIADPQQLRTIEIASPHIADADSELWVAFIKRDIPDWKDKIVEPKNPRSWWKVYRKLYREEQAAQEQQQQQLKAAMNKEKEEKESHQTNIISTVVQQRSKQFARVGSLANANKSGKNIISAIRKASTKPSSFRGNAPVNNVEQRMWKAPPVPQQPAGGVRRRERPNLIQRGPPSAAQAAVNTAFDRAIKEDEKLKAERAKRASNSPPPAAATPLRTASPAVPKAATPLGPGAGTKRAASPEKASPVPQKRSRAPVSIFMPKKAKR